jgi:hypothetical protein
MAHSERAAAAPKHPRSQPVEDGRWHTALTFTAPNQILVRGFPLDEMMGSCSWANCRRRRSAAC